MIHVTYVRSGLHVVAMFKNDAGELEIGLGFTQRGALKRLLSSSHKSQHLEF